MGAGKLKFRSDARTCFSFSIHELNNSMMTSLGNKENNKFLNQSERNSY